MIQGFSTGGEYGGASTFIAEYAPDKKRGFFGSFLEMGTLAGYTGAAGLVLILNTTLGGETMHDWGWRIPFLVAGPLGLVGLYLRMKLDETPAFQKLEAAQTHNGEATVTETESEFSHLSENAPKKKLSEIFAQQWPMLILCIALVGAYNICHYMLLSYMPTYLTDTLHYDEAHGLLIVIGTMVVLMCIISSVGKLNDRFGRKPLLMTGMLASSSSPSPRSCWSRRAAWPRSSPAC